MEATPTRASEHTTRGLLQLDVRAELRKFADHLLDGMHQLPTELVRRALRQTSTAVQMKLHRNRCSFHCGQLNLAAEIWQELQILLDPNAPVSDRHAAIVTLENADELALLATATIAPQRLTIHSPQFGQRIELRAGRLRVLSEPRSVGAGLRVDFSDPRLDIRRSRFHLEQSARFCAERIELNGRPLRVEAVPTLARVPSRVAPGTWLEIPAEGERSRIWVLRHGLVATFLTLPELPWFQARIECGDAPGQTSEPSPAELRAEVRRQLPRLVEEATSLLIFLGGQTEQLNPEQHARVQQYLLQAHARRPTARPDLEQVPAFQLRRPGQPWQPTSLAEMRVLAQADTDGLRHVPTNVPLKRFRLERCSVLALSPELRHNLCAVLGVELLPCPRRRLWQRPDHQDPLGPRFRVSLPDEGPGEPAWRRLVRENLQGWYWQLRDRLARPTFCDERTAAEARLETELSTTLDRCASHSDWPFESQLIEGAGPIRRLGHQLLLPRDNPRVRAYAALLHRQPEILPALLQDIWGPRPCPKPPSHLGAQRHATLAR